MSARDELGDLQNLLGVESYVAAIWSIRERQAPPVPRAFTRNWRWRREKVVNLAAYRKRADDELEAAGSGGLL